MDSTKIPEFEKISDVSTEFRKNLNKDTVFKFECLYLSSQEKLLLKATEINAYTPFYFEELYTLEDIYKIGKMFRACVNLSEVPNHIKALFAAETTKLEISEDGNVLIIIIKAWDISALVDVKFHLKKKTVDDKDNALKNLYIVTKNNEKKINEILLLCKNNNDGLTKEILELLKNSK